MIVLRIANGHTADETQPFVTIPQSRFYLTVHLNTQIVGNYTIRQKLCSDVHSNILDLTSSLGHACNT